MSERSLKERLTEAYQVATQASHGSVSVAIHVGPAIFASLRQIAAGDPDSAFSAQVLNGVPIIQELAWPDYDIQVRTRKVIP